MTESNYKVHKINFIEFQPKPINAIAYGEVSKLVAVSRGDGSIEIRDPNDYWAQVQHLPGQDGRSIESLVWLDNRLFSGGLSGEILEWNSANAEPINSYDSCGGPIWTLRLSRSRLSLAAACEDGSIRLFEVLPMGLLYGRHLDKQKKRILSMAWSIDDKTIVTGGADGNICLYNVETGHVISTLTGDSKRRERMIIWTVNFLSDMTIVSGDSQGKVKFWDGNTCTLVQTFNLHLADVLTICVSEDEETVYASGVDSKVVAFELVAGEVESSWICSKHTIGSNYDTRALAYIGGKQPMLLSGGVDSQLIAYNLNFTFKPLFHFSCFPKVGTCQIAGKGCLLGYYEQHTIHIWLLCDPLPQKVVEFKAKGKNHIKCFAMSDMGTYFAYSSADGTSVYQIVCLDGAWSVRKLMSHLPRVCAFLCFSGCKSLSLVAADHSGVMFSYRIKDQAVLGEEVFQTVSSMLLPYIWLSTSRDLVAVFDAQNRGHIFNARTCKLVCVVPSLQSRVIYAAFRPRSKSLLILTASQKVEEFDYSEERFLPWCWSVNDSKILLNASSKEDPISKILFNPCHHSEMFIVSTKTIGKILYGSEIADSGTYELHGKRKLDPECPLKLSHKYNGLLFFDFTSTGEMVAVERKLQDIAKKLPPRLKVKKFGY